MEQEDVLIVIDKLTDAKISLNELNEIKPLIGTEDFTETYLIVAAMEETLQAEGRLILKKEIEVAAKEYHDELKVVKIKQFNRWMLPSIAAVLLVVCSVSVIQVITDYNNPKNFRKIYIENIK